MAIEEGVLQWNGLWLNEYYNIKIIMWFIDLNNNGPKTDAYASIGELLYIPQSH